MWMRIAEQHSDSGGFFLLIALAGMSAVKKKWAERCACIAHVLNVHGNDHDGHDHAWAAAMGGFGF